MLSRFADEEVDPAEAVSLASHAGECEPCGELLKRLRIRFGTAAPSEGGVAGSGCVGEETLLAHLSATLPSEEEGRLKGHLAACDACVNNLSFLHRRLNLAGAIEAPVPAALKARALAAIGVALPAPSRALPAEGETWGRRVERRFSAWLRLPVLIPLSVAAGALLMVTIQEADLMSTTPRGLTRAVDREARLRVTAPATNVREEPHRKAEVIAVVTRGTVVEIAGEERDWYRVKLADERMGWVERDAFE
jgi:hypothetical protein